MAKCNAAVKLQLRYANITFQSVLVGPRCAEAMTPLPLETSVRLLNSLVMLVVDMIQQLISIIGF